LLSDAQIRQILLQPQAADTDPAFVMSTGRRGLGIGEILASRTLNLECQAKRRKIDKSQGAQAKVLRE